MTTGNFNGSVYAQGCNLQLDAGLRFFQGLDFNNKVVLDCACGNGKATLELMKHFQPKQVFAFDASESQIAEACKLEGKVEWFVATFDNFLDKKPELKGKVDIIISNFGIQFAPSLERFFSLAASALCSKGTLWAAWPVQKHVMGDVMNAAKNHKSFAAALAGFAVDELHPNGVVIPGKKNKHHLSTTFDALQDFDRSYVAKVKLVIKLSSQEEISALVKGINPARDMIPKDLLKEYDDFCAKEMSKAELWSGTEGHIAVMQVRTQLLK